MLLFGSSPLTATEAPKANLDVFRKAIWPVLKASCLECHGPDKQKAKFRVDALDPDLLKGKDVSWWLEVQGVLTNGEMPPPDSDVKLADADRVKVVDWLAGEIRAASEARRAEGGHTTFRRMTRYEYKYAMQDLLGLPHDFSRDLPPETSSEDGFKNSSDMLQMTAGQFAQYRAQARRALELATVRGDRPAPVYYGLSMRGFTERFEAKYAAAVKRTRQKVQEEGMPVAEVLKAEKEKFSLNPGGAHFKDLVTGQGVQTKWAYHGAKYAWKPVAERPTVPPVSPDVLVMPANSKFIIDVGDGLPDTGIMRVRIRAAQEMVRGKKFPTLRLHFGNQASNDSRVSVAVGGQDLTIDAPPGKPRFYHWDVPLAEIPRNAFRHIQQLGQLPNPAEFIELRNTSSTAVGLVIDYVEVIAPLNEQWPPESHTAIFFASKQQSDETKYTRAVLEYFMRRAWRRPVSAAEVDQKMKLFKALRPQCEDFQEAVVEVLATVLASPNYLYLGRAQAKDAPRISDHELASRLSFFLWSSTPDTVLMYLAEAGKLSDPNVLEQQARRLLADPRAARFARHYTRQWLGMEQLDFVKIDAKAHGKMDPLLLEAMKQEPVALFTEMLRANRPVTEFLHADYVLVNDRLARHYGVPEVYGDQFRKVTMPPGIRRGGLLTSAGLLVMNSDGKDSHPLKRGIWLLENLLHDPPPPPPPAVPEIDLADPEILKMTLKQRMEDHRSDPACISCHSKIDPWGIAFENFDALGQWRDKIGDESVDAASVLFNKDELRGMKGLKDYLLANRQDQFARAMAHKMAAYALGRPLTFGDRAEVDRITAALRKRGDGLADLVFLIVKSELFRQK